ncbi:cue domain-containing protein 1 [Plakobranchus ocellatus]|uniref:Cue domain-containing protein 1 n=1 Tax=Plakobranchus ocellatus TaxID=259542 RepID=A0AAV4AHA1_9GAST|nr:cue domain-containing protein 1 [Plakobranchus ocellatus]
MTETDQFSRMRGVGQGEESPGRPPGRPMRQLEFSQAMSDFCYMFPETDEEVIEAVLRANNGMVDATIDQLLTMNIDAEVNDDDDLSDKVLLSLEKDMLQQQQQSQMAHGSQNATALLVHQSGSKRSGRESKSSSRKSGDTSEKTSSKDCEDCPPSYTEAVQSHSSHHHRSNGSRSRHRHSPTTGGALPSRQALSTMQHLLDLGPDTAPSASAATNGSSQLGVSKSHLRDNGLPAFSGHHHHHHHVPRTTTSANHHRRRWAGAENNGEKSSRPGRNLLASAGHHFHHHHHLSPHHHHHESATGDSREEFFRSQHKKGSVDGNDLFFSSSSVSSTDNGHGGKSHEKSSHRWRSSHRGESTNTKRPAYRNWNPPLLGTLPDDFLRISTPPSVPTRPSKHGTHLHRTMSAVGPESRHLYPLSPSTFPTVEANGGSGAGGSRHSRLRTSGSHRPHRSLSFAGNTAQTHGAQHEFSPDLLQERMKENERRRRMTSIDLDPALAMYLEDERLALMLQNSEFLQELRGDRMFMLTLERGKSGGEGERNLFRACEKKRCN